MTTNEQDLPQGVREFAQHYANERHADLLELDSNYQARIADAKWPEDIELIKQYCLDRFDHHGEALLPYSGSADAASINPVYAQHLETAEEKTLKFLSTALQNYPPSVKADVISWVSLKLSSRKLYWLAHATRLHLESHPAPVIDLKRIAELQARANLSTADISGPSLAQPEALASPSEARPVSIPGIEPVVNGSEARLQLEENQACGQSSIEEELNAFENDTAPASASARESQYLPNDSAQSSVSLPAQRDSDDQEGLSAASALKGPLVRIEPAIMPATMIRRAPPSPVFSNPGWLKYEFPQDFPQAARERVYAAYAAASQIFEDNTVQPNYSTEIDAAALNWSLPIFAAFVQEACALGTQGHWRAARIESECLAVRKELFEEVRLTTGYRSFSDIRSAFEASLEWKTFRKQWSELALGQVATGATEHETEPVRVENGGPAQQRRENREFGDSNSEIRPDSPSQMSPKGVAAQAAAARRGRPSTLDIFGDKVKRLRGDLSQTAFKRSVRLSLDVIQRAEKGKASEPTITKLCDFAAKSSRFPLTREELINTPPEKPAAEGHAVPGSLT